MSVGTQPCPPPSVMPVIFVPGIMGSRLKNARTGRLAWDPGSNLGTAWEGYTQGAAGKRARLVGAPSGGFDPGLLEVDYGDSSAPYHDRGWGGLMQDFYGGFVTWLQHTAAQPGAGVVRRGCFNIHYEAYAHPYNWMDSNIESGQKLGDRVDQAIAETEETYGDRDVNILKPVIITHSMGGLVCRAFTEMHGGASKVHAVIHGAMPTHGSPATYKRIMAGFEGWYISPARHVLGANQRETTATAGNGPGPLSLLPNDHHVSVDGSAPWLKATGRSGSTLWSRPSGSPYSEIYLDQSHWWRMIYARYLNPAGGRSEATEFRGFRAELNKAKALHDGIAPSGYHANTRMIYVDSDELPSFDHVEWKQSLSQDTPPSGSYRNSTTGTLTWSELIDTGVMMGGGMRSMNVPVTRYEIQDGDAPGDGTVHAGSGRHVSGPMVVATRRGAEHDQTFNSSEVKGLVAQYLYDFVQEQN
ncbi:MAG: esterase/lipase family protein [Maritimibacter sp.]